MCQADIPAPAPYLDPASSSLTVNQSGSVDIQVGHYLEKNPGIAAAFSDIVAPWRKLNMRFKTQRRRTVFLALPLSADLSQSLSLSLSQVSHLQSGDNMDMF